MDVATMYNIGVCHMYTDQFVDLSVCILCIVSFSGSVIKKMLLYQEKSNIDQHLIYMKSYISA